MRRTSNTAATFATAYRITPATTDDWFDPALQSDTPLFVDPFLMFDEQRPPWSTVEQRLTDFFNTVLLHVAAARGGSVVERTLASAMLSFPEPAAFCLGYGRQTIFGSGSAQGMGRLMLRAADNAITAGIDSIDDFGQLLLFGEGMGADRISDLVCNVIKADLIGYTQAVSARHGLPTKEFTVRHAGYDFSRRRWRDERVQLPANPCWTDTPVLLVPRRFLDDLPGLGDDSFWDWVYDSHNAQLRHDLGVLVSQKLDRRQIIALARRRATLREKYGRMYVSARRVEPLRPYNIPRDPKRIVLPVRAPAEFSSLTQVQPPSSPEHFADYIFGLANDFKRLVEDSGLWRGFWDGLAPRDEATAQFYFRAAVTLTCRDRNIDVSPETNAGVGPVDFKFSQGWSRRSVVELKLASSSSFLDNVEEQPPAYMKAEGLSCGVLLVIQHEDKHCTDEFTGRARAAVQRIASERDLDYRTVFVDARPKQSASKRKRER